MMKIFHMQMKKLFSSPLFYVSVFMVTFMCLCSPLHINDRTRNNDSVIYCITQYPWEEIYNGNVYSDFSLYHVFRMGIHGWVVRMFIPVFAAIAAVNIFCDERDSGTKREILARTGQKHYIAGSSLFFIFSGGLVCMSGYALYFLIAGFFFPHMTSFPAGDVSMYFKSMIQSGSLAEGIYTSLGLWAVYALKLFVFFLYGSIMAAPALALAGFLKNKYLIVCIPFFLKYIRDSVVTMLFSQMMITDNPVYGQVAEIISSDLVVGLDRWTQNLWHAVLAVVLELTVLLVFFVVLEKVGVDKGD